MDGEGLGRVLAENRARLIRFFTSRTGSPDEAEDVVQEIWLHIQRADCGPIANPLSYLHRVGMNLVIDRLRGGRRRTARDTAWADATTTLAGDEAVDEAPSPFDQLAGREAAARAAAAIAALPPGARRVFTWHRVEGRSHAAIAAELGISRSAVEKHIAVALRHLRVSLDD